MPLGLRVEAEIYYPIDEEKDTEVNGVKTKIRKISNQRYLNGNYKQSVNTKNMQMPVVKTKLQKAKLAEKKVELTAPDTRPTRPWMGDEGDDLAEATPATKKIELTEKLKVASKPGKNPLKIGLTAGQFFYTLESRDINTNGVASLSTQDANYVNLNWENRFVDLFQFNFDYSLRFLDFNQPTNRVLEKTNYMYQKVYSSLMFGKRWRIGAGLLLEERPFLTRVSNTVLDFYTVNLYSPYLIGEAQIFQGEKWGLLAAMMAGTVLERNTTAFKIESGANYMGKIAASYDWQRIKLELGPYYNKWDVTSDLSIQEEKEWGGALNLRIKF